MPPGDALTPNAQSAQQTLETFRSEQFLKLYSNSCQLEVSPWDFTLIFGELNRSGAAAPKVEERVSVVMSPQHAKALLGVLATNVEIYEKQVGAIKLPQTEPAISAPTSEPQ